MRGIGIIVTLVIAAIVGVGAYQLGVAQGLATTGTAVAPARLLPPFFFGGSGSSSRSSSSSSSSP